MNRPEVSSRRPPVVFYALGIGGHVSRNQHEATAGRWCLRELSGPLSQLVVGLRCRVCEAYPRADRSERHLSRADGVAPCPDPRRRISPRSLPNSSKDAAASSVAVPPPWPSTRGLAWRSCLTGRRPSPTSRQALPWGCILIPCASGGGGGHTATSPWPTSRGAGASPVFPPRDRAIVKANTV
jgi:hypothetical protein